MAKTLDDYRKEGRNAAYCKTPSAHVCRYRLARIAAAWQEGYDAAQAEIEQRNADAKARALARLDDQIRVTEDRLTRLKQERNDLAGRPYHATMWDIP